MKSHVFNFQGIEVGVNTKNDTNEELEPVSLDASWKAGGLDVEEAKHYMKEQDRIDRELQRKRIKEKHKEIKKNDRQNRQAMTQVTL